MTKDMKITTLIAIFFVACSTLFAEVNIETVAIGNTNNLDSNDIFYGGPTGRVDYFYEMGKYEITTSQYAAFLNSVAKSSYNPVWWGGALYGEGMSSYGRIIRSGSDGNYIYTVQPGWENKPVSYVSFHDAIQFANWMHHGQQNNADLQTGSYTYNGYTRKWIRTAEATWVIPTKREWFKAACHKNDGNTGNYWNYATQSMTLPDWQIINPDPGNNANYGWGVGCQDGSCIISPTDVGEFENSESAYGTFDQNGNVEEYIEEYTMHFPPYAFRMGGSWERPPYFIRTLEFEVMEAETSDMGFRLAKIPQPVQRSQSTISLLRVRN